jgi:hypothetical protein
MMIRMKKMQSLLGSVTTDTIITNDNAQFIFQVACIDL